jgi:hypothetical protein
MLEEPGKDGKIKNALSFKRIGLRHNPCLSSRRGGEISNVDITIYVTNLR